jgi:hypothetical protein
MGSGKPDPGRECVGRSQNLKGGVFRGRRGHFHAPIFASGCGMKTLGAVRVKEAQPVFIVFVLFLFSLIICYQNSNWRQGEFNYLKAS